jgi:putative ABC transport system permease protein
MFGLAPALQHSKNGSEDALKEGGRTTTQGRHVRRLRRVLAISEISLALVLLAGAGLLIESFRNLVQSDLGFRGDRLLTAQLFLLGAKYPFKQPEKRQVFVDGVIARAKALPGVESVAAVNFLPLSGFWGTASFTVEGQPKPASGQEPTADSRLVTPDYFRTMGIRMLLGRDFTEHDRKGAPQVAIVNQTVRRKLWGDRDPIGRKLNFGDDKEPAWSTVVGVVDDVKSKGLLEGTRSEVYRPFAQIPFPLVAFVVRTPGDPAALTSALEKAIWSEDPDEPLYKILPMQQLADESLALRRISMLLLSAFSGLAVLLAAVGIYGVMAYSVTQRTHEIGLRIALGASRGEVLRMTMREALFMVLPGLGLGLAGALALTRAIGGMLYGVAPTDPRTFLAVSLMLACVAIAASYVPARRATSIDPVVALRVQ